MESWCANLSVYTSLTSHGHLRLEPLSLPKTDSQGHPIALLETLQNTGGFSPLQYLNLVGGFSPVEKYARQIGSFLQGSRF